MTSPRHSCLPHFPRWLVVACSKRRVHTHLRLVCACVRVCAPANLGARASEPTRSTGHGGHLPAVLVLSSRLTHANDRKTNGKFSGWSSVFARRRRAKKRMIYAGVVSSQHRLPASERREIFHSECMHSFGRCRLSRRRPQEQSVCYGRKWILLSAGGNSSAVPRTARFLSIVRSPPA